MITMFNKRNILVFTLKAKTLVCDIQHISPLFFYGTSLKLYDNQLDSYLTVIPI